MGAIAVLLVLQMPTQASDAREGRAYCSIRVLTAPIRFGEPHTLLRVVALADTVVTDSPLTEDWRRFAGGVEGAGTVGQHFEIVEAAGPNERGLAAGDTMTVVPWEYDGGCSMLRWSKSSRWVDPGSEGVFSFSAGSMRESARATFDAMGWHSPYPHGEYLHYEARGEDPEDPSEWLMPSEMFALWAALPVVHWRDSDPDSVMPEIRGIFDKNPRFKTTFPGSRFLQEYESWASGRR